MAQPNITTHLLSDSPTQNMIKLEGAGGNQVLDTGEVGC